MTSPRTQEPPRPRALDAIFAIAVNTFREGIRDRILYLLLAFALLLIAASRFLSLLTVGDESKIIKDLGLSAISVFGLLTSMFVGVSLVFKEIERRTVYTLLAKPVSRWQFVAGKYAGLLAVLAMNVLLMSAVLAAILLFRGESPVPLLPAELLILVELAIVTAFAILFSSFTNPILSAVGTAAVYVTGHLSWSFDLLSRRLPPGAGRTLCDLLHAVLPNLDRLDLKTAAVHALPIPPGEPLWGALYGAGYIVAVLILAAWLFSRRDFP
ncbi:MAG: ABC transporter permease [Acidobacteriia bacterium]|nr:ABC transporter permease [Terriglobia bacterium]